MQAVRHGRRQSVGGGEPPKVQQDLALSSAEDDEVEKKEQRPAQSNSNSFSRDLSSDNELNLGDNGKELDVAEKKRFAGVSRRKSISYDQDEYKKASAEEQRRERNRKKFEETELVDDILEIPELGDDGEGDITTQVAAPPKEFRQHRMQTISQLDRDVQYHLPTTNIDLSMLTMTLSPANKVEEDDVLWTGESLLQDLASSMDVVESVSS
ncbi:hypothetical protein HOP50_06g41610 [Chloropicon primus]|uniref:Intraflagellar transport protein 43 n=1 Tax=Chloropicon primus TaxID=1764295 RepID=A0A5B8MNQ8_9CHLO|nr:hypothetical protein A3770_06p41520 [Chloropicon primus]UPR00845.1 hypothetical protein HOP50_06g41610 [Chloropicon primus]|eukprot:QDZ21634.1 hypothetical protein A3770_06p41520 [Chloropicon primus]